MLSSHGRCESFQAYPRARPPTAAPSSSFQVAAGLLGSAGNTTTAGVSRESGNIPLPPQAGVHHYNTIYILIAFVLRHIGIEAVL